MSRDIHRGILSDSRLEYGKRHRGDAYSTIYDPVSLAKRVVSNVGGFSMFMPQSQQHILPQARDLTGGYSTFENKSEFQSADNDGVAQNVNLIPMSVSGEMIEGEGTRLSHVPLFSVVEGGVTQYSTPILPVIPVTGMNVFFNSSKGRNLTNSLNSGSRLVNWDGGRVGVCSIKLLGTTTDPRYDATDSLTSSTLARTLMPSTVNIKGRQHVLNLWDIEEETRMMPAQGCKLFFLLTKQLNRDLPAWRSDLRESYTRKMKTHVSKCLEEFEKKGNESLVHLGFCSIDVLSREFLDMAPVVLENKRYVTLRDTTKPKNEKVDEVVKAMKSQNHLSWHIEPVARFDHPKVSEFTRPHWCGGYYHFGELSTFDGSPEPGQNAFQELSERIKNLFRATSMSEWNKVKAYPAFMATGKVILNRNLSLQSGPPTHGFLWELHIERSMEIVAEFLVDLANDL